MEGNSVQLPQGVCCHNMMPTVYHHAKFINCMCGITIIIILPHYPQPLNRIYKYIHGKTTAAAAAESLQSCPTLCNPIDGSPPGSPVPGILQARTLEQVAISFSNA